MLTIQEHIINVPEIEPRMKHPTIFQVFDSLIEGESLIIHNDHDPKPVYYQLLAERGDIFTWQYLENGPEVWRVRIIKKDAVRADRKLSEANVQEVVGSARKDVVINVPEIEPRLKHPMIFQVFDELAAGESLIIHNDHDPKPVYYQLLGERGDVFIWQYLQQGPQWWDVRVTKKGADDKETVGQIAARDLRKAEVFKKYGIDFCCGGKKTVREICAEKGIDATKVEQELQQSNQGIASANNAYNEWNLDFLADYLVNTHHAYVRKNLPEMQAYAFKVARVHGERHPELVTILNHVVEISEELSNHLVQEETQLFPLLKQIVQAKNSGAAFSGTASKSLASVIAEMEQEHDSVGRAHEEIRRLSNDFTLPPDACASYSLFYKIIQEFENDLHMHIHLENNILFPKAVEMEQSLS